MYDTELTDMSETNKPPVDCRIKMGKLSARPGASVHTSRVSVTVMLGAREHVAVPTKMRGAPMIVAKLFPTIVMTSPPRRVQPTSDAVRVAAEPQPARLVMVGSAYDTAPIKSGPATPPPEEIVSGSAWPDPGGNLKEIEVKSAAVELTAATENVPILTVSGATN